MIPVNVSSFVARLLGGISTRRKFSHATFQCFKICYEGLLRGFHDIFGSATKLGYNIVSVGTEKELVEGE